MSVWAAERGEAFFRPVQASDAPALGQIAEWVNAQSRFAAAAKTEFLQIADYYLVAQALAGRHTVVTLELPAPASQKTVKIPDVCLAHDIKYTSPFRMLRDAGIQFVLPPPPATEPTLFDPAD